MALMGIQAVVGKLKGDSSMTVQSLIFPKERWTKEEAAAWCKDHDYRAEVDETGDSLRYRQRDPGEFEEGSFRTAEFGKHMAASEDEGDPRVLLLIGDSAAGQDGLRRIPVALITRGYKGKQQYSVTASDLRDIVANFRRRKADVVVDYEHSTLSQDGQPKPTAGWLKRIEDEPDARGVLWGHVEYTPEGAQHVAAKDYKYVSPVIEWGRRDKTTGQQAGAMLTSLALVKQPLFESLPELPLVASDSEGWVFDRGDAIERREKTVKITKVKAGAAGKVRLVADDNTETEFAVEGLRVVGMADVQRGSDGKWDFSKIPQGEGVLVGSDVLRAMDVQAAIDGAIKEGKITVAQRGFYEIAAMRDLDGFKALAASMKANSAIPAERGTAAGGAEMETYGQVEAEVLKLVAEAQRSNPKLDYGAALKLVAAENPDLIRKREMLLAGGK